MVQSSDSSSSEGLIFSRMRPRDRHLNSQLDDQNGLRYCFNLLKMVMWKSRLKLRKRCALRFIHDEQEIHNTEGIVILRQINGGFIFGFQGCLNADEMKARVSALCGPPFNAIMLLVDDKELKGGGRLWNFERLKSLCPAAAGFSSTQHLAVEITVVISQVCVTKGKSKGISRHLWTDWPGDPSM